MKKTRPGTKSESEKVEVSALDLSVYAETFYERQNAASLNPSLVNELAALPTESERRYSFRLFAIPRFNEAFVEANLDGNKPLVYFEPFAALLAQSRCFRQLETAGEPTWPTKHFRGLTADEQRARNLARYDSWLLALHKSHQYFLEKRIADYQSPNEDAARAALFGGLQRLAGLPPQLAGLLIADLRQRNPRELETFYENAAKSKPAPWKHRDLVLWLIEIWPLVREYHWTYRDVWNLAARRFEDCEGAPFETAEAMSNHCKMRILDLRLSERARRKGGRPRNEDNLKTASLPPMGDFALTIHGLAENLASMCEPLILDGIR